MNKLSNREIPASATAPVKPTWSTSDDVNQPPIADNILVKPDMGPNHTLLCEGLHIDAIKDQC